MFEFADRLVILTGASGTLGRETGQALLDAGATLVLVAQELDHLQEAYPELEEEGEHMFAGVDLTEAGAVEGMVYEVMQQFGRIDALINLAGGYRQAGPVHETPRDRWEALINLNLYTVVNMARAVVPHMLRQGSGKIVNVSADIAQRGRANMAPYAVAKSGVVRLTESMAQELRGKGINVNCIVPVTLDTPENRESMPKANFERWVQPADLAQVILFLVSDAARAIHGAAIPVAGGA